ncbi:glycoside hydrolase family 26 protein [Streptacidiphilus sp. N1-12]|uniref:Glycoside hydrolase family 26 protein n=2 Tax=Streptacidiphilus alkalitolerans TaxID=3342712 RepID=A0ABV6WNR7_9ACTN
MPRRRVLTVLVPVLALAAASVLLLRGGGTPGDGGADRTAVPAHAVPFGAFLGSTESDASLAQLSAWLGGARIQVGHTYLPGNNWSDIEGSAALLGPWARWRDAAADRLLVIGVPMLPDNEGRLPDAQVRALLGQGATGQYDAHFTALARRLVALGAPDAVLTLGWEMNGSTYTSRCGPDPEAWKEYWRNIVHAMRAVPGQRFRFEFAPTRGADAHPWPDCYPGDDVTDVIGMDSYDLAGSDPDRTAPFSSYVHEPYGLLAQVRFAAEHHKPVSYPEWGMYNGGDDPAYVRQMLAWVSTHRTLYQTITDYCPHGVWRCGSNPGASDAYRAALALRPVSPTTPAARAAGSGR